MIGEQQFPFLAEKSHVVSLVGGGGKTTLLYAMASHCAQKGWRVLVSTTTHILRPENGLWAKTDAEIQELWARGSYAVVGSPAPNGKLTAPPEADLAHWKPTVQSISRAKPRRSRNLFCCRKATSYWRWPGFPHWAAL